MMGNWNAKLGSEEQGKSVGPFGLGERNERGDRLADWCVENRLVVTNTWFKTHPRRQYTWKSPGDRARNQIDFIMINQRFRNAVKHAKVFPGADCKSDHNPVVMRFKLSLKQVPKPVRRKRFLLNALRSDEVKTRFKDSVITKLNEQEPPNTIDEHWKQLKTAINEAAEFHIPKEERRNQTSHWMTTEIKDLMEQRRLVKNNEVHYNLVDKEINEKCKEAKEGWLEEKCQEVERLNLNPNSKEMFKKIREIAGKRSKPASKCIKDKSGKTLFEEQQIAARWEEYIKKLFEDDQPLQEIILETAETGPPILRSDVEWAVKHMKQGKSPGPAEISTDMLLALEAVGIDLLFDLITKLYETGTFPADMIKSVFVPLPKISGTLDCTSHRTISLMSHSLKVLLKIILQRIRRKLLPEISEAQYGFMKDRG